METRTYDPEDDGGIGKLVRDALGESHRPFEPGDPDRTRSAEQIDQEEEAEREDSEAGDDENPFTAAWPSWEDVPTDPHPEDPQDAPDNDPEPGS